MTHVTTLAQHPSLLFRTACNSTDGGAAQDMALTGSMTAYDLGSSGQKVMLRSTTAVDRSHACCWVDIAVSKATATGTPGTRKRGTAECLHR